MFGFDLDGDPFEVAQIGNVTHRTFFIRQCGLKCADVEFEHELIPPKTYYVIRIAAMVPVPGVSFVRLITLISYLCFRLEFCL